MNRCTVSILASAGIFTVGTAVNAASDLSSAGLVVLNQEADGALTMTGSSAIHVPAATVYVNSSSRTAVRTVGSATLDTPELKVVGQANFGGQSECTGDIIRVAYPFIDPLVPFAIPNTEGVADRGGVSISSNAAVTLQPGHYTGGILVTGNATITLSPGLYIIDHGLDIRSGHVSGEGVTLFIRDGSFRIAGTSQLTLSPPSAGSTAGLVMAMSPDNSSEMTLVGGSEVDVRGTIYAPKSLLTLRGNSTVTETGPTMGDLVIADRVLLSGTGSIRIGHAAMPAVQLPSQPLFD